MIQAIIFDCYGVLASGGWLLFKRQYLHDDPAKARQASEWREQLDMGQLSNDVFLERVSQLSGVSQAEIERYVESTPPNTELLAYIAQELKPHYKIGFLSNAASDRLHALFTAEQAELFDAVVLSYQVGLIKPDPRIYRLMAEKLGVAPAACVMVDDLASYCQGARDAGMQAVQYKTLTHLQSSLAELLAA